MLMWASTAVGRYYAGEMDVTMWPQDLYAQEHPGIIFCHGATARANVVLAKNGVMLARLLSKLVDAGWPLLSCDLGPTPSNWGNDAEVMPRMDDAYAYAMSVGFKPNKVHLFVTSMGNVSGLRWAAANSEKVASIVAAIPAYDMELHRQVDGGLRTPIDSAWGTPYPAPLPAGANPPDLTLDVPWLGYYSSDDRSDFVSGAQDCAVALGGDVHSLGPLGHTDLAMGSIPLDEVATFYSYVEASE